MVKKLFSLILCSCISLCIWSQTYTLQDNWVLCRNSIGLLDQYYSNGVTFEWRGSLHNGKAYGLGIAVQETSTININTTDMVVMSACESGLGEISGDGVFGLQPCFKLAKAKTLLMSLWKVDDEATRLLMTEFYRHYLSVKTKQESLHLAQQTLRQSENYSDSHYWAAFILLDAID